MDRLLDALSTRIRLFTESGDRSAVLDQAAVGEARRLWQAALSAGAGPQVAAGDVLAVLACLHWCRFQVLPAGLDHDDLRMALTLAWMLAGRAPERVPDQLRYLFAAAGPAPTRAGLKRPADGVQGFAQYQRTGRAEALEMAVTASQDVVAATLPRDPVLAGYLSDLAVVLLARYERAGDGADLAAAVDAAQRAVATAAPGHPALAGCLSSLGNSLRARFERVRDGADLNAAIDAGRRAVAVAPVGHPGRARFLSSLAASLLARFGQAGDGTDLGGAVEAAEQAVDVALPYHPELPVYLSSLGVSLHIRFERAGAVADLDRAIDAGRQAVTAAPSGHPCLALHLSNLGASLHRRFERAGDGADLDDAIKTGQRAVAATPPGHPDLARRLANLAASLRARFDRAGDGADLDDAAATAQRAVAATPPGHVGLTPILSDLNGILLARYQRNGDVADLDAAIGNWRQASQVPAGTASTRLAAARKWGLAAAGAERVHEAAEGYAAAVALLPTLAWHGLDRAAREEQLARWAGLAADAAACAVLDGHPERAVELLEQGRSVLWTQALNLRSDLAGLAERHPDLAARLRGIRKILDTPTPDAPPLSEPADGGEPAADRTRQDTVELRRRKAREWDEVLAEVRTQAGFAHFMAATPYSQLAAAAASGPVVIVNASRHGCHALIVQARRPARVVDLPAMTLNAAVEHANLLLQALGDHGTPQEEDDRHAIVGILGWLWDTVAAPVLAALGHTGPPRTRRPWPRVW